MSKKSMEDEIDDLVSAMDEAKPTTPVHRIISIDGAHTVYVVSTPDGTEKWLTWYDGEWKKV
jgi:hypothetical protein